MTRRIICAILALTLCFGLAISVSAETEETSFVIDELGCLTDDGIAALNTLGSIYYDITGVGIFYVYTKEKSVTEYDVEAILNGITDYVVTVENDTHWYLYTGGKGEIIDEDALRAVYDAEDTYIGGVAAYMDAAVLYFPELSATIETAAADPEADEQFIYDDADILTDSEEAVLEQRLTEVSHACNAQITIATIASMDDGDIDSFVDYLYDTMGFGYGKNHDGVLILVCMDPRAYQILSNGYAGVAIGPDQIDSLCDIVEFYLSQGSYATAFTYFINECEDYLVYYQEGSPFNAGKSLVISLAIGLIVGLIVTLIMKGQLKSVRKQNDACVYVKQDSMTVKYKRDIFLYRNVTCTKKQERAQSGSSDSGGSTRSKGGGTF